MKKAVSLILALLIISTTFNFAVSAAGTSISNASAISFGKTYSGVMVKDGEDYYKFTLSSSGRIKVSLSGNLWNIYAYLYSADGSQLDKNSLGKDSNSDTLVWEKSYDLVAGVYYLKFSELYSETGNYSFSVSFDNAQESFSENQESKNNSFERSNEINFSKTYKGQIALNDESDYYKFTLSSSGRIKVSLSGNLWNIYAYLYSADGSQLDKNSLGKDSNSDTLVWEKSYDLVAGVYYLKFSRLYSETGNYSFSVSFDNAQESFSENQESKNNSFERSNEINFSKTYKGQIALNDESDYYKFTLSSSGRIKVSLSGNLWNIYAYLYSADGSQLDKNSLGKDSNSDTLVWEKSYDLVAGVYYLKFSRLYSETGNYSFSVSKGSSTPTQAPTTRPAERPTSTRPVEAPTTRNNTEKPTQAPTKAPEYIEPETYVEPEIDPDIDVDIDIYVYTDFEYTIINNYIVILNYIGDDADVIIPEEIDGYEVKGIGDNAFADTTVESVDVPDCITQFGSNAFGEDDGQDIYLYCSVGSAAQNYADEKGIACVLNMMDYSDDVTEDVDGGMSTKTIIIIAVVAVVAIGAIIAVIVIGKKKSII